MIIVKDLFEALKHSQAYLLTRYNTSLLICKILNYQKNKLIFFFLLMVCFLPTTGQHP